MDNLCSTNLIKLCITPFHRIAQCLVAHVSIQSRGTNVAMPHQFLDDLHPYIFCIEASSERPPLLRLTEINMNYDRIATFFVPSKRQPRLLIVKSSLRKSSN